MHVASTSGNPSAAARPSRTRRLVLKRAAVAGAVSLGMPTKAAPGVAGDLIRFGQSAPVTGVAQLWGIEYQRGIRLAFVEANAEGGVGGRRLELVTYDDLFEPTAAESNTAELIDKERVFALIGYVGADAAYQRRLAASCSALPEYASLEGWIAGSLVVLALRKMGPTLSRDGLETALESLSTREMDGLRLQWDAARRQFRSRVTLTVLDERGRPRA